MSSLRTQANVKACKLLRNAPPTHSGGWIVAPTCKLSQRACISLFVLALFFDAEQCCSVITSLTGISQFARQSYQPIPWCPGGFTAEPCVFSLSSTRSFVCLCFQWRFIVMHWEIKCACCLAHLLRQGCHPVIHDFECDREFAEIVILLTMIVCLLYPN